MCLVWNSDEKNSRSPSLQKPGGGYEDHQGFCAWFLPMKDQRQNKTFSKDPAAVGGSWRLHNGPLRRRSFCGFCGSLKNPQKPYQEHQSPTNGTGHSFGRDSRHSHHVFGCGDLYEGHVHFPRDALTLLKDSPFWVGAFQSYLKPFSFKKSC